MKTDASKHRAMSYRRMKEQEARLAAEVAELLRQAQEADGVEDHPTALESEAAHRRKPRAGIIRGCPTTRCLS